MPDAAGSLAIGAPEFPRAGILAGVPEGADALLLGAWAAAGHEILHVARDDARLAQLIDLLNFFAPSVETVALPAWDTLPYDRVSPNPEILAERAYLLAQLSRPRRPGAPGRVVATTVSAVLQRVPPRSEFESAPLMLRRGERAPTADLLAALARRGFARVGTVREPGEFAVRGGLVDLYPPGAATPFRLDYFGDALETIRTFDPITQMSIEVRDAIEIVPVSELVLDETRIARFRENYRAANPQDWRLDPLYAAISAGQRFIGMEHWLPLFFERLETLFHYLPGARVTLDHQADEAVAARLEQIEEYHAARREMAGKSRPGAAGEFVYRPVAAGSLFLGKAEWRRLLAERAVAAFSPFAAAPGAGDVVADAGFRRGLDFAEARRRADVNLFDAVGEALDGLRRRGSRVVIAAFTLGSRDRLADLLVEHRVEGIAKAASWAEIGAMPPSMAAVCALPLERGIVNERFAIVTEQDILGDRLARRAKRRRRSEAFVTELSSLQIGDLVVHEDHGIGRYDGLETLSVAGAPHDCLRIVYAGGDKLFLPVENIELVSRYGSDDATAQLDKLGGAGWQQRKSRIKKRIREIADKLLGLAARRQLKPGAILEAPAGLYDEFAARFPYAETEDQQRAIDDVIRDLAAGRPMDRLVCGDVGFGKTEVALRAALVAVMAGKQVAVVGPTTLLARQHHATFRERFHGLPIAIAQLSRLVTPKEAAETKRALAAGEIDIAIGTHALLGKSVTFKRLGLVIVDEEQHFGVAQKERLKELCADVHVLTLTATPIPRTLQMALTGVRDLSLITTPPIDRLAVRTFVLPYDPVVIREALHRELFRGGQVFYVCPRIEDLASVAESVRELAPEAKVQMAHGQMPSSELEGVMSRFYDRQFQILVSTNIVESGLDIPSVNTIVIHRADRFGLAQLYQLRGRVGRSKLRAYAYLTVPPQQPLGETATRRLEVMQTLDTLGAGFQLASHDMDIRGAGNLLGEEQSGHVREVGIELYQQMLEDAVAAAREAGAAGERTGDERWTPQIAVGIPVLIPESYVADLGIRLGLYRRLADLIDQADIDGFAAELVDRFGALPDEVRNLLDLVALKRLCLKAGVEKIDAGPKGAVVSFHGNRVAHPDRLVRFVGEEAGTVKLKPDHKLVYRRDWRDDAARVKGVQHLMRKLVAIAT
jgi:transcription-repair coupling factor (superfamily II helicase)